MDNAPLSVVRLRPKIDPRPLRRGFPWVYADQLVTDRRTKALEPGSFAVLEDTNRAPMALVTVNTNSKIIARVMDTAPDAVIDGEWMAVRIQRALDLREKLYAEPYYRLVHAEADGLPGVVIDRFGDTAVIQPNAAWADVHFAELAGAVQSVTGVTTIIKNAMGRSRKLEGLDEESSVVSGSVDGPIPVLMNGATYMADVLGGQKTGLFLDQRANHAFAAQFAKDADVLDVFSHVGGFGLAALAAGATRAVCVDGSAPALELARQGVDAMGAVDRFEAVQDDAFSALERLAQEGAQFDVVICDPPAFAPSKQALEAGLRAYERIARLATPLVRDGGMLVLCSCSHAAEMAKFRSACIRGIGKSGRSGQILHSGAAGPDHPMLPQLAESGYLKSLFFRL
jgi:23S rRNA (cytosine1962-C5)-methyltransferase